MKTIIHSNIPYNAVVERLSANIEINFATEIPLIHSQLNLADSKKPFLGTIKNNIFNIPT